VQQAPVKEVRVETAWKKIVRALRLRYVLRVDRPMLTKRIGGYKVIPLWLLFKNNGYVSLFLFGKLTVLAKLGIGIPPSKS